LFINQLSQDDIDEVNEVRVKAQATKGCTYLESKVALEDNGHCSRSELVHLFFPKISLYQLCDDIKEMNISDERKLSIKILAQFIKDHGIQDLHSRKGFKVSKVFS